MSDTEPEGGARWRDRARRIIAPHRPYLALALLAAFMYFPSTWLRHAWNPDEPRYAEVAREMVSGGEYVLPHLNGEVYGEKPPVFFWLSILAAKIPGIPFESGPRLVSLVAAWLTLVLTFRIGLRLADPETAWLGALVLSTSGTFAVHASTGVIDGTLALLVVSAIAAGMKAREEGSPILWLAFYLAAALAVLTKGPVGLIIPAGVLLLLSLADGGLRGLRAAHPIWGMGVVMAVIAAWLVPAIARGGPAYAETILWKQSVGRAVDPWHHEEPFHYFLKTFPISFLPWIALLPTALYGAWRSIRSGRTRPGWEDAGWSRAAGTPAIWFGFVFIFFSLLSSKKTRYLLPLVPAASLLVAVELRKILSGRTGSLRARLPLSLCCLLVAGVGLSMALLPAAGPEGTGHLAAYLDGLPPSQTAGLAWIAGLPGGLILIAPGLAIAAAAILALRLLGSDRRTGLACLAASVVLAIGCVHWIGAPVIDPLKSGRPVAAAALEAAGHTGAIVLYEQSYQGLFNLLLARDRIPIERSTERLVELLHRDPGTVVIPSQEDTDELAARIQGLRALECLRVGGGSVCVSRLDQGRTSASTVEPESAMTLTPRASGGQRPDSSNAATSSASSPGSR